MPKLNFRSEHGALRNVTGSGQEVYLRDWAMEPLTDLPSVEARVAIIENLNSQRLLYRLKHRVSVSQPMSNRATR